MASGKLLTDEQMRAFLTNGFLVLKTDLPREFHQNIHKRCETVLEKNHGNPGNNILPFVPELQAIFDCPTVSGALDSVLGPRRIMHPHRHMHANKSSNGGAWHKDSYWGYTRKVRNHRPWWAMIMYYSQDVNADAGPTGVMAGSPYYMTRPGSGQEGAGAVTGEAGTCFLIHYDLWHRATPNTAGINRQMFKFEFIRMDAPEKPVWNSTEAEWRDPASMPPFTHHGLWRQSWNFMRGDKRPADRTDSAVLDNKYVEALASSEPVARTEAADRLEQSGRNAAPAAAALAKALSDEFEPAALNAAYALAAIGKDAIPALTGALHGACERASLNAAYAFSAMGAEAIPALLHALVDSAPPVRSLAAFALGEIREGNGDVTGALASAVKDPEARVRLHAVEALGIKGKSAARAAGVLVGALRDADKEVRFNAVLALARIGPPAAEAAPGVVDALVAALEDEDRYVRGYAVEALHQVGTKAGLEALIHYLKATRWCTSTGPDSQF